MPNNAPLPTDSPEAAGAGAPGFGRWYVAPTLVLLVLFFLPLISGSHTLFLRDVFNTHLEMKWWQTQAMREGILPLLDAMRSGGQPHLGNPNTVALYPDNLLYLLAPFFWAFNAHFWLHALLAPAAMFWLGRRLGLGRPGAWAAAVAWVGSGYFLSQLNLYNLVAATALLPALAAGVSRVAAEHGRRWSLPVAALLWALVLLAGDPMTAALGVGLALTVLVLEWPGRSGVGRRGGLGGLAAVAASIGAGTLLAAPQLVEFWRILGLSFRGHWGFSSEAATATSWHPAAALEWLIPLAFGGPGMTFWGGSFHAAAQPLFYSLFPGVLALALVWVGARSRSRQARWALAVAGLGLFAALGRYNPVMVAILELPGFSVLRLPVKFWPLVAVPASILVGLGFERALASGGRRDLRWALGGFAVLYSIAWLGFAWKAPSLAGAIASVMPEAAAGSGLAEAEAARWIRLAGRLAAFSLLALTATFVRDAVFPKVAALLLVLHLVFQLTLLQPLIASDAVANYPASSPVIAIVPPGSTVVHASSGWLFGSEPLSLGDFPDLSPHWLQRKVHKDFHAYAGIMAGLKYEFALTPEGLDGFLTRVTAEAMKVLPEPEKIRLLAASGVGWLFAKRPFEISDRLQLAGEVEASGGSLYLYKILDPAPEAYVVGRLLFSENLNQAVALVTDPSFRPVEEVVLAGAGEPGSGERGEAEILEARPESWRFRARSRGRGAFVFQRAYLPIYRARVNGRPAELVAANMHRMAILLEDGEHEIELWVDRRPVVAAAGLSLLTLLVLVFYGFRSRAVPEGKLP